LSGGLVVKKALPSACTPQPHGRGSVLHWVVMMPLELLGKGALEGPVITGFIP